MPRRPLIPVRHYYRLLIDHVDQNTRLISIVCAVAILFAAAHVSAEEPETAGDSASTSTIGSDGWPGAWRSRTTPLSPALRQPSSSSISIISVSSTSKSSLSAVSGKILGKTRSGERCRALSEITNGVNDDEDVSFYEVWFEGIETLDAGYVFGFGILGLEADKMDPIDLDGNGVAGSFFGLQ